MSLKAERSAAARHLSGQVPEVIPWHLLEAGKRIELLVRALTSCCVIFPLGDALRST
jgi:hypothetical protein